jgi:predicted transposase/invertase (TIGR01784 family)
MQQVASLQYGVIFKKAFCDPEIFTAFVSALIGREVQVDHVETEKEFSPPIGYVKPRFDLFAEDREHRIIVDIQHARTIDHYDRFLYYHCAAILEQITNAKNYHSPLQVVTIVVLTSGDRHQEAISVTDFAPRTLDGRLLNEIPHKIIFLCPKYVVESTPEPYREWLMAINDTLDEEVDETQYHQAVIHKLFDAIRRNHISPEERARMIDEYHQEELLQTKFDEWKLAEKRETAASLLKQGIPLDVVAKATGLPEEELKNL